MTAHALREQTLKSEYITMEEVRKLHNCIYLYLWNFTAKKYSVIIRYFACVYQDNCKYSLHCFWLFRYVKKCAAYCFAI